MSAVAGLRRAGQMGFWRSLGLGASSPDSDAIILREPDKPGFEEDIAEISELLIGDPPFVGIVNEI